MGAHEAGSSGAGGNAHEAGRGGAGNDTREAGRGGASGNSGNAISSDAEDAGSSEASQANGEPCASSADCASGYECIPTTADSKNGVCVDTSQCNSRNQCARDYWAAICQLDQLCSNQSISFDQCYQKACTRPPDSNDLCMNWLATTKSLIASRCCPPAGAYHSSCDPAPQCGCQDGEKCNVFAEGQTSCGPAGSGHELDACDMDNLCMAGHVCTTSGCNRYCEGPGDPSCAPTGTCKPLEIDTPGSFVCTHSCDPTSPETADGPLGACRAGQRCEPEEDGYSDCYESLGSARQGASCVPTMNAFEATCAPGFFCNTLTLTCTAYCKVAENNCEVGTCSSAKPKQFALNIEIGYCAVP